MLFISLFSGPFGSTTTYQDLGVLREEGEASRAPTQNPTLQHAKSRPSEMFEGS